MRFDPPLLWDFSERLETHLHTSLSTVTAFVGVQPDVLPPTGYVVADLAAPDEWADRASGLTSAASISVTLRCVGTSAKQAVHTMDLVAAAMRDWKPFDAPNVGHVRLTQAGVIVKDDSIKTDVRYSIALTYRFDS